MSLPLVLHLVVRRVGIEFVDRNNGVPLHLLSGGAGD